MTTAVRTSPVALAAWVAIVLGTAWLVLLGGGFFGIYVPQLRVVSVALAAVSLGVWGVVAARHPSWRPRSAIWPALAAPLAAFAVSTLTSVRPRVSLEYLGYTVLLVGLYLLLRAILTHGAFRDRVASLSIAFALVIGMTYLAAVAYHWSNWFSLVGTFRVPPLRPLFEGYTYGNPSAVLTMSVLLTTAAIAHLGLGSRARRVAVGTLLAMAALVALVSGSRAGWLAIAVAVAVVVVTFAGSAGRPALARLAAHRRALAGYAAVVLGGVLLALVFAPGILLRATSGGEGLRTAYVVVAGRMFAAMPLTGGGPGTWVADRMAWTNAGEPDYYVPHAHNIYAQTAAEHGLVGIVAGMVAIAALAWLVLGGMRDRDPTRRRWGWAAFFGIVYFGTHQLLDFYANMPAILFAFAIPIAWLDATAPRILAAPVAGVRALRRPVVRALTGAAAVTILLVSIVGLLVQERAATAMNDGFYEADGGRWSAALVNFEEAAGADPGIPAYRFARGLAEARVGDPQEALATLERVAVEEDLPVAWIDVAALRLGNGDPVGTIEAIERALRLGQQQPAILFAAGALQERLGDPADADVAWSASLRSLPSLAGDPWWADPARAVRWTGIRDAALVGMPAETAADLWLSSGDEERATGAAALIADPAARERTLLAIAAWDGGATDRAALDTYARDHPFDLVAVAWAGRVAARAGDLAALYGYRLWAETVVGTASAAVGEIRVAPLGSHVAPAGLTGTFWGQYTYRRPTPADQLVPALPHLVLTP